ncbi:MAG: DUF4258 domain-containing protein [Candidatus Omnitrophica bacterium]|nr:DUF4258 domain-containing protein [Candidatus Omnitrophota bacterium]
MKNIEVIKQIRKKVREKKYRLSLHSEKRMDKRKIPFSEVKHVISTGKIIESYTNDKPFPSYLILGYTHQRKPLYVLCALGEDTVHIITVHWMDPKKWLDPETRRERRYE